MTGQTGFIGEIPPSQSTNPTWHMKWITLFLGLLLCGALAPADDALGSNPGRGILDPAGVPLADADQGAAAQPNIRGTHSGSFIYGRAYGQLAGKSVEFTVTIKQEPGSEDFTGVVQEPYSGFGVAHDGKLWADIRGTCRVEKGVIKIKYEKTYRYFEQPAVTYSGTLDPGTGTVAGKWLFLDEPDNNGTFELTGVRLK